MSNDESKLKQIFIDEHVNIYVDEKAAELINSKADKEVVDPIQGVVKVGQDRWFEAQRYERRTWLEKSRRRFSDRNEYHRDHFAAYTSLRGRRFNRGIELGCGPFTNLRFILEHCEVKQIHLLDPLIEEYLSHSFCKYNQRRIGGVLNDNFRRIIVYLRHPFAAIQNKLNDWRIGGLLGKKVIIENSMIENYHTINRFDLVVMINVLEHCQNANEVFNKIDQILLPEGIFVYHDKIYNAIEVDRLSSVLYDAGHPLKVDQSIIEEFLERHFKPLMRAEYYVNSEFHGLQTTDHEIYYIGQKK